MGQDPRQGIDFKNVRFARTVEPEVYAAPIPDPQEGARPADDFLHLLLEPVRYLRGAAEYLQGLTGCVPDPLGFIGIDRFGPGWKPGIVDFDDGKDLVIRAVAQDTDCKLPPGKKPFDDDRLPVRPDGSGRSFKKVLPRTNDRIVPDALARSFVKRLDYGRQRKIAGNASRVLNDRKRRVGDSVMTEDLLGSRLVETYPQGQGIGAGIGQPENFADGRNMRLAVGSEKAFRYVEYEIRIKPSQTGIRLFIGFNVIDPVTFFKDAADGRDRIVAVALGQYIRRGFGIFVRNLVLAAE